MSSFQKLVILFGFCELYKCNYLRSIILEKNVLVDVKSKTLVSLFC